jgi:hypothetical protein
LVYALLEAADEIQQKEFISFVTDSTDKIKVCWLAISGDLLTAEESAELSALLTGFFSKRRACRSLAKHGLGKATS